MKNNLSFAETENGLNFILSLPKQYGKPAGSDFDIDKAKARGLGVMLDIVGAFSPRIIACAAGSALISLPPAYSNVQFSAAGIRSKKTRTGTGLTLCSECH